MMKDAIVQFVSFVTSHTPEKFIAEWENYTKKEKQKKYEPVLLQQVSAAKSKPRYISQHIWPDGGQQFSFSDTKKSAYFPEMNVQLVQLGGYTPLQFKKFNADKDSDSRIIVLLSHNEYSTTFYEELPHKNLNIYQAYYESCQHSFVLEYYADEKEADELITLIKQKGEAEVAAYRDCLVPHL